MLRERRRRGRRRVVGLVVFDGLLVDVSLVGRGILWLGGWGGLGILLGLLGRRRLFGLLLALLDLWMAGG